mgnify:CR=1 FL=1
MFSDIRYRVKNAHNRVPPECRATKDTPIGTPVRVHRDNGELLITVTRSMPWQLGHGEWIVSVEGIAGGYLLGCVEVIPLKSTDFKIEVMQ